MRQRWANSRSQIPDELVCECGADMTIASSAGLPVVNGYEDSFQYRKIVDVA